jgi:hypothetical protein
MTSKDRRARMKKCQIPKMQKQDRIEINKKKFKKIRKSGNENN